MTGPLTTRAALLQLLRQAPDYGSDLIRRFAAAAGHRAALAPARVYPILKQLEHEGLVRATRVAPGGDRGARARIYYALTARGGDAAERDRRTVEALLGPLPSPRVSAEERRRMAERIVAADELSQAGEALALADR